MKNIRCFRRMVQIQGCVNKISVTASIGNAEGIDFYRKKGFMDFSISLEADI